MKSYSAGEETTPVWVSPCSAISARLKRLLDKNKAMETSQCGLLEDTEQEWVSQKPLNRVVCRSVYMSAHSSLPHPKQGIHSPHKRVSIYVLATRKVFKINSQINNSKPQFPLPLQSVYMAQEKEEVSRMLTLYLGQVRHCLPNP